MGANNSKAFEAIFTPLPAFNDLIDFATTLKFVAANLVQKVHAKTDITLSDDERDELDALDSRKEKILRNIRTFVLFIESQVQSIKAHIQNGKVDIDSVKFHNLTYGEETVGVVLSQYSDTCMTLAKAYERFGEKLEKKYYFNEATRRAFGWIFIVGGILGAAALIFYTAGTAAPFVITAALATSAATTVGFVVVGAIMVSESETERATRYLKKVSKDLRQVGLNLDGIMSAYVETSHVTVMENIDRVLKLTQEISSGIENAIKSGF